MKIYLLLISVTVALSPLVYSQNDLSKLFDTKFSKEIEDELKNTASESNSIIVQANPFVFTDSIFNSNPLGGYYQTIRALPLQKNTHYTFVFFNQFEEVLEEKSIWIR